MKNVLLSLWAGIRHNPKTTAGAIAATVGLVAAAVKNPGVMTSAEWWAGLFMAQALLWAADAQPATKP
jgi:hypothetical protein